MRKRKSPNRHERRPVIETSGVISRADSGSVIMRGPARGGPIRRGGGAGAVKFLVFLGIVGVVYWALATFRHDLVERLPAAYPILKAMGLELEEPAGFGIEITSRADRVQDENRQWVVYVRGRLTNRLDRRVSVPRLQITVTSSNARPLVWTVEPEITTLAPGQQINFQSRYSTPFALRDVNARVRFEKK